MRIALLYNRDIYAQAALGHLIPSMQEHRLELFFSQQVGRRVKRDPRLDKLSRAETTFSGTATLSFEELAVIASCKEQRIDNINSEGLERVADCEPDLIVSIRFGQILEEPVIAVPRIGVINLHSGLLPAYKGVMASFWSLLNGERQLGTTLHWITDSKIDSGAIISTQQQQVDTSKTYLQQVLSLYEPGARQITEAVNDIEALAAQPHYDLPKGQYYSFPETADIDQFEAKGLRLL